MPKIALDPRVAWSFAAVVSALLLVWFGAMAFLPFSPIELSQLTGIAPGRARALTPVLGFLQIALGIGLLPLWPQRVRGTAALLATMFWLAWLVLLLSPVAYVQDPPYGGFPYIGGGQTVLKHVGLGALTLALWSHWTGRPASLRVALFGIWAALLLVLVWIGLTKFTLYEALGVEGLMRASPLFSWLYLLFDVRGAARLIGVIELLTAALIAMWPWRPQWGTLGLVLVVITFVMTTTFLFTTPGWQAEYGAPVVGGAGQFLLKDLGLAAGALLLLARPTTVL